MKLHRLYFINIYLQFIAIVQLASIYATFFCLKLTLNEVYELHIKCFSFLNVYRSIMLDFYDCIFLFRHQKVIPKMSKILASHLHNVRIRTLTMPSVVSPENYQFVNNHQVRFTCYLVIISLTLISDNCFRSNEVIESLFFADLSIVILGSIYLFILDMDIILNLGYSGCDTFNEFCYGCQYWWTQCL